MPRFCQTNSETPAGRHYGRFGESTIQKSFHLIPMMFRMASPSCPTLRTLEEASSQSMNLEMVTLDTCNKTCNLKCLQLFKCTLEVITVASLLIACEENTKTYNISKLIKGGAGETGQGVRMLTVLPEVISQNP